MLTASIQSASQAAYWPSYRKYREALQDPRSSQEEILFQLLARMAKLEAGTRAWGSNPPKDYKTFASRCPITSFSDWENLIARQRSEPEAPILSPSCHRFEPTSGSSHQRKWIPYSAALMAEFDRAASPWLFDLGMRFPGIKKGRHYWSLSWIPNELRESCQNDEVEIFPFWKRLLLSKIMAAPSAIARLTTLEESFLATLVHLSACRDLSLLSVWSPTFALELLRGIEERREQIAAVLRNGKWELPLRAPQSATSAAVLESALSGVELFKALWPGLSLVSCWTSSTSATWAEKLAALLPHVPVQGKGLWATEGVITIPFEGHYPLAIRSHFLEFRCLGTGRVLPSWRLETGQKVQPILTTGSGLLRYALEDELEVTGSLRRTPSLRFLGRKSGTDLVGEKIHSSVARETLDFLSREHQIRCVSLIARSEPGRPRYLVLAEGAPSLKENLAKTLESSLMKFHHYRLARELGQLDPAGAIVQENALELYFRLREPNGIAGAMKVEPLLLLRGDSHEL